MTAMRVEAGARPTVGHRGQGAFHGADFDYDHGSPHLRHAALNAAVVSSLQAEVASAVARTGRCRVLELGAGHGAFTATLVEAGAEVLVTEMSSASADRLRDRFAGDDRVRVEWDHDGDWAFRTDERFDLVACLSVLHHIPDYVAVVDRLTDLLVEAGTLITWQDPRWHPSQRRRQRVASDLAYYAWRLGQPDLRRGLATRVRRIRGVYDDDRPEDTAEYHVVRDGVDQLALLRLLERRYAEVRIHSYWSTQAPRLQRVGERLGIENTFALLARGRLGIPSKARSIERDGENAASLAAASIRPPVELAPLRAGEPVGAFKVTHVAPGGGAPPVSGVGR
jgi:SAM-dependent methyltransferase